MKMSCYLREEVVQQKACSVDTIDTIDSVDNSTTREASSCSAKERDQGQKTIFARTGGGGGVVWCSAGARGQFSTYLHQYQLLVSRVRARARAGTIGYVFCTGVSDFGTKVCNCSIYVLPFFCAP